MSLTRRTVLRSVACLGSGMVMTALGSACAALSGHVRAPRIGVLVFGTSDSALAHDVDPEFDATLRQSGWVEGQNITIDRRITASDATLPQLISDLVRLPMDVLVVSGSVDGALTARQISASIPIVVSGIPHPVEAGLVSNLRRPGANLTVLSSDAPGISAKSVELLRDTVPRLRRLAVLVNTSGSRPQSVAKWDEMRTAAERAGIQAEGIELRATDDAEQAFATAASHGADAIFDAFAALTVMDPSIYARLALARRLPIMTTVSESVQSGFLMSYGPNFASINRRAAVYVDKILRGANAGDLPVEQPTVFDFAVNASTAQVLGISIPRDMAAQVTQWVQ